MTSAAVYARVSSTGQKKDQTIGSQTEALRVHAARLRYELPEEWVFEDEGHSGASLVRPALERLRDLVAQAAVDVVLCYAPDRLARKFAYQALLIEEFARAGTRVEFVRGPRGESPEDQLLVQFQGIFAEYEKAQLMERYRRGKAYRARAGSVNVLGGAPFGYRYRRKTPGCGAAYEIVEHEAAIVAELFCRYTDTGASIAELTRWLTSTGTPTRTGKRRWDRSVVWGMLRNPAYAGQAAFGKTRVLHEPAGLNRRARLEGRTTPRPVKTVDQPRREWTAIPVPAIISRLTFERAAQRLADNKKFASRNSKVPSLLQGMIACATCGYGYYRSHTTTTAKNKIYYYRCLGSDDYRYEGGRICASKPVRADYLDALVWDHITGLLADPQLIRTEIDQRLEHARTSNPATREQDRLQLALAKADTAITRMIEAYQEQLITIDELRTRMPGMRARQANLRSQFDALQAQLADRDAYLKLADDLEGFLAQLHRNAATADVAERQRVLRLLVKDILIGPEKITIRHRIPLREPGPATRHHDTHADTESDEEGDRGPSYLLRWGREDPALRGPGACVREGSVPGQDPGLQERLHQGQHPLVPDSIPHPLHKGRVRNLVEARRDVSLHHPLVSVAGEVASLGDRIVSSAVRAEPVGTREEIRFEYRLQHQFQGRLDHSVCHGRNPETTKLAIRLGDHPLADRNRMEAAVSDLGPQLVEKRLDSLPGFDGAGGLPIHSGRAGTLVSPDTVPRHQ